MVLPSNGNGAAPASRSSSPNNRIKFLCSHGGKILPRPTDGQIKYVGGETRVISVDRDISFHQLMKKLTYLINGEMVLKYQVMCEDLDALVSVKSDEDVGHMFDEITHWENAGTSRLRTFLFPANPVLVENQLMGPVDPLTLEQQYVDAINGIIRSAPRQHHPPITNTVRPGFFISSSASSSPNQRSPESCEESNRMMNMHKVKSSPNLCMNNVPQQHNHHYTHHYYPAPHQSHKPALDLQRSVSVRSSAVPPAPTPTPTPTPWQYYYPNKQNRVNGHWGLNYEESRVPSYARLPRTHTHGLAGWEV